MDLDGEDLMVDVMVDVEVDVDPAAHPSDLKILLKFRDFK